MKPINKFFCVLIIMVYCRYEGLSLLQTLISHQKINLTRDQQAVVLRCLQHPDNAIKVKSLHLLCKIADSNSAESICDQVYPNIKF